MKTLQVIIEKGDDGLYGRIEGRKSYHPATYKRIKQGIAVRIDLPGKPGRSYWPEII